VIGLPFSSQCITGLDLGEEFEGKLLQHISMNVSRDHAHEKENNVI
jgi:hypothetical protein